MQVKYGKQREDMYAAMAKAEYGTFFSYEDIDGLIKMDSRKYRFLILTVQRRLEKTAQRTLRCDFGKGYSIANPQEHVVLGAKHHKRAKRQLRRATSIVAAANRSKLTEEEKRRIDNVESCLLMQQDAIRHLERRTSTLEKQQLQVSQTFEQKLAEAMERIAAVEEKAGIGLGGARHGMASQGKARSWQVPVGPGMVR